MNRRDTNLAWARIRRLSNGYIRRRQPGPIELTCKRVIGSRRRKHTIEQRREYSVRPESQVSRASAAVRVIRLRPELSEIAVNYFLVDYQLDPCQRGVSVWQPYHPFSVTDTDRSVYMVPLCGYEPLCTA